MSTHNICFFYWEIRKLLCGHSLLSGATQLIISLIISFKLFQANIGQNNYIWHKKIVNKSKSEISISGLILKFPIPE